MEGEATAYVVVDRDVIASLIASLKRIDVRGFESMDRLVGCVIVLQKLIEQEQKTTTEGTFETKEEKEA